MGPIAGAALGAGGAVFWGLMRWQRSKLSHQADMLSRKLREAQHENTVMEVISRHASDGLLIQDINARIEWSNPAYSRMTGYSVEELRGQKPQRFILPPESRMSEEELENYKYDIDSGALDVPEIIRNVRKDGSYFWNELRFAVVEIEKDEEPKIVVIARDVTEQIEREEALRRAKEDIQRRAETDVLTGLPNRMKFNSYLEDTLTAARQSGHRTGVIHVDLDQFKEVNDTLGHAAGDAVLVHAAEAMLAHAGPDDLVCRFGGDEFIIVCPDAGDFLPLEQAAKAMLVDLHRPLVWGEKKISISASIGIAMTAPGAGEIQELMKQADVALYEVKRHGRNGYLRYSDELGELVSRRTELSSALSHAISNNEMGVVLQPQFDLASQQVTGFEALVRWYHPRRGILSPIQFFDVAECNGYMEDIDLVAMRGALDSLLAMRAAGYMDLTISINVSARTLQSESYLDTLKWEVERRGLLPQDVIIEVLETVLIVDTDNAAPNAIKALSEAGFGVELDDFGTGYSGLSNLTRLKIDGVKIDRALVRNLTEDKTTQTVVKSILRLCRDLGLTAISEGVERPEQASFLYRLGGSRVQGYGVARPMPLDEALDWLQLTDMTEILIDRASFAPPQRRRNVA